MKILLACALALASFAAGAAPKLDMVVNAQWLAAHLADPDLVLLHVGRKEEFEAAHIPGARLIKLSDIAVDRDEQTLQLPTAAELKARLGAFGIGSKSKIVVYYAKDWVSPATRVIFTLYAAGLGEAATLLDGGMGEWLRQGHATSSTAAPTVTTAGPEVKMLPVVVDAAFVRGHAVSAGYTLIDARAPVYYDGIEPSGDMRKQRKGHIPGAVNIPFSSIAHVDNTLKTRAEWEAMFRAKAIAPGSHAIVYCHIGQQATAILFAARAVGIDAVLYDGSFEDWTWHDGPVETRARP